MGEVEVYLHAGAHRTGTSSFQVCLHDNRDALRAAGYDLAYPGRDGIPSGRLRLRLPRPGMGPRKVAATVDPCRDEIARHLTGAPRFVLSEENIPGRMYHFYYGQFFPGVEKRLDVLAKVLPGPIEHLVYVTRPYDALFTSAFRKRAEDNPVEPFDDLRPNMVGLTEGWVELIAAFKDRLRPRKLTVIDYAARGESRDLVRCLVPAAPEGLVEPAQQLNLSATDAALEALQARYHAGETLSRAQWQAVIARHADDRAPRGFAAFSDDEVRAFRERYARDLDTLDTDPDVTVIRGAVPVF